MAATHIATMPARARISPGLMIRAEKLTQRQKIRAIWKSTAAQMMRLGFMEFTPGAWYSTAPSARHGISRPPAPMFDVTKVRSPAARVKE
jgi:hypothetical protein